MSRVMTFARVFPSYHPRAGQPTYFIEKIYASLADTIKGFKIPNNANAYWDWHEYYTTTPKHHTIRAGHRWKVGDKFSPRVWSGKPYQSKQIVIAPDIEVKKTWPIRIDLADQYESVYLLDENGDSISVDEKQLALNDGLTEQDFYDWFDTLKNRREIFKGQVICWNDQIEY
jgi:hypothetical protein